MSEYDNEDYENGYSQGYSEGYDASYEKGREEGRNDYEKEMEREFTKFRNMAYQLLHATEYDKHKLEKFLEMCSEANSIEKLPRQPLDLV